MVASGVFEELITFRKSSGSDVQKRNSRHIEQGFSYCDPLNFARVNFNNRYVKTVDQKGLVCIYRLVLRS